MTDAEPGPRSIHTDNVPSSFDESPDFFDEKRLGKLWRRLKEEPLIPIGCLATCYALYQATKSIRAGDHHQTNRMFRARIYAQGFTLVALVAGSIFYQDDRMRRRKYDEVVVDKKAAEKREKWLRELERRDLEDREWRERFEGVAERARAAEEEARGEVKRGVEFAEEKLGNGKEGVKAALEEKFKSKSVLEQVIWSGWGPGMWVRRTREAWRRR